MVSFFLSKLGILTPRFMRKYRKHAIVIILLLAGILTPSPDITSQLLLGIPLLILYEISILISRFSQPKS
jgi:sec-independent protein translocase protein TatC